MNFIITAAAAADMKSIAPVSFAQPGDVFTHRSDDSNCELDTFEYQGRTTDNCFILRHVKGRGFHIVNGGVRDAIGA